MTNRFLSALLAATFLAAAAVPASAVGPNQTFLQVYPQFQTYSATQAQLTPAASATDFFTITGSATKTVYVKQIGCTGTSTAAASQIITAVKRSTADTLGTSTGSPAVVPLDSLNAAGTATVLAYTANPTTGTAVGSVDTGLLQTLAPASANVNGLFFNYSDVSATQPVVLHGITEVLALNANGASFAAGTSITCKVVWSER